MTEELTMIETKSLNSDLSRSPDYQATADSGTTLGYQATADAGTSSGRGYQATVNPTNTPPGPLQSVQPTLRDISSGVHPTLSYLEVRRLNRAGYIIFIHNTLYLNIMQNTRHGV